VEVSATAAANRLLGRFEPEDREAVRRHLVPVRFDHGHVFFEPGDRISHVHFVEQGVVSLVTVMKDGSTVETMTIGHEGVAGVGVVFNDQPAFGRAIGQIPGRVLRMEAARLRQIAETRPRLRLLLGVYAQQQLAEAQQTAACNALHTLGPRLAKWLLRCHDRTAGDTLLLTQEFLGDMLGAQRTTVTMVARSLQQAGLITYQRGRIEVLDRAGLERISCECYATIQQRWEQSGLAPPGSQI
jgi:CRP-like cAMP-binding protein